MDVQNDLERVQVRAAGQGGRISRYQLEFIGVGRGKIQNWIARGILIPTLPSVFAVGFLSMTEESRLWDAVLHAGPGAYLTGASAAHYEGLIRDPPDTVTVATPRNCVSLSGVTIHRRRTASRRVKDGALPLAPIPEMLLTLAAQADDADTFNLVRHALANLEFRRELDVAALLAICTRGRNGSALLRRALEYRIPQLAYVRSPLEVEFLLLLEAHHLPLPTFVNRRLHGIEADMYWPELKLVVELDGKGNHGTAYQQRRDAGTAATLERHGLTVIRFGYWDVNDAARVPATLMQLAAHGVRRAARRAATTTA